MKLLIIEDELQLAQSMMSYLSGDGYKCEFASTYKQALQKISSFDYDCILLDIMLPGGDGFSLLEELKHQQKQDGVIIISARDSQEDKIRGLQEGADDYLSKPFHLPELAARIFSVIRRRKYNNSNLVQLNELTIDLLSKRVLVNNEPVSFTRKEYDLLLYLIGNRNRVVSKNALAEYLSGDIAGMLEDLNFIYAHIKNLKRKLHEAGCPNYLKTVYGTGYIWQS